MAVFFLIGFYAEIVVLNGRIFVVRRSVYIKDIELFDKGNKFFKAEVSYIKVGELFIQ